MLVRAAADAGWTAEVEQVRMGWITPLSAQGLVLIGPSGETRIEIQHVQATQTILDTIVGRASSDLGPIDIDGLSVETIATADGLSIQRDIDSLPQSGGDVAIGEIKIRDAVIAVTDPVGDARWTLGGGQGTVQLSQSRDGGQAITAAFEGVVTDPDNHSGEVAGEVQVIGNAVTSLSIDTVTMPLSVIRLYAIVTPEQSPVRADGTLSGRITADFDQTTRVAIDDVRVDNLSVEHSGQTWTNRSAMADGLLVVDPRQWTAERFRLRTDFATITGTAHAPRSGWSRQQTPPNRFGAESLLRQFDGEFAGEIDLVTLHRAMPGLLPLSDDATLVEGRVTFEMNNRPDSSADAYAQPQRVCQVRMETSPIRGRRDEVVVTIDPILAAANLQTTERGWVADQLRFESSFGALTGQGTPAAGQIEFDLRIGRLHQMLEPLLDRDRIEWSGTAAGNVRWQNESPDRAGESPWNLSAEVRVRGTPSGNVDGEIQVTGLFDSAIGQLRRVDTATVRMDADPANVVATLRQPVVDPIGGGTAHWNVRGEGSIEQLANWFGPAAQSSIGSAGRWSGQVHAATSGRRVVVGDGSIRGEGVRMVWDDLMWDQSQVDVQWQGQYDVQSSRFKIDEAVLVSPAVTGVIHGGGDWAAGQLQMNLRTELVRLQNAVSNRLTLDRQVSAIGVSGEVSGDIYLDYGDDQIDLRHDLQLTQLVVTEGSSSTPDSRRSVRARPASVNERRGEDFDSPSASQTIWYEPSVTSRGQWSRRGTDGGRWSMRDVAVRGDWFQTTFDGNIDASTEEIDLRCDGQSVIDMEVVALRLSDILKTPVAATGLSRSDLQIRLTSGRSTQFDIAGQVGWDAAQIAGVAMGPASLPVHLTQTEIRVDRGRIPVGGGHVMMDGRALYHPGPVRIEMRPGRLAETIELTPAMTSTWMKYLAPVVAGATNVSGVVSADIDRGWIDLGDPLQTDVAGRLRIGQATMTAGTMVDRLLVGVDQARSLAAGITGTTQPRKTGRTLVSMPPQVVEFAMQRGVVQHDRMYFGIDRAEVVTSGTVDINGNLRLVAQIPIDESWVGRDLGPLAGRPLTLPVNGNLSAIEVDTTAVGRLITQAVITAGQSEVGRYLDNQLGRGLDKLLGR